MLRHSIPNKYTFKFFYVGVATLALLTILMADILSHQSVPMLVSYEGITADLALTFLLFYTVLEIVNYRDSRRFVDHSYYFDIDGVYREHAFVMDWKDVSEVKVTMEKIMDRIPAHRDTAWEPYFNILRDYSTPELITRKKVARVLIKPVDPGTRKTLIVQSTTFRPLLLSTYRKMKKYCFRVNESANFGFEWSYTNEQKPAEQSGN